MRGLIITATVILGIVALAESTHDGAFYSTTFMDRKPAPPSARPAQDGRKIASRTRPLPKVQRVGMGQAGKINGHWRITRILDEELLPVYDIFSSETDAARSVVVRFELVSLSTVMIDGDAEQVYSISLLTEAGTIALFKPFGKGYEVIEAKRLEETAAPAGKPGEKSPGTNLFNIEDELLLDSALGPRTGNRPLGNNRLEGTAELRNGELYLDRIILDSSGDALDIDGAQVKDHGYFEYEHAEGKIQGVVSVIGKGEIKVRFTTGPLANTYLNFVVADLFSPLPPEGEEKEEGDLTEVVSPEPVQERETGIEPPADMERSGL